MCMGGKPDTPKPPPKPDPVVVDEDQNAGEGVRKKRDRSKMAQMYGNRSMQVTSAMGVSGGAATGGRKALGA